MKQIIVNVDGLTIEEKQRVNEALAKIKNIRMCNPMYWDAFDSMYGPSCDGVTVGCGYHKNENPTHTPQQVLTMAGMAPSADQHVFFADMLIITDSSGNIIYDSTLDVANLGKGDSVKFDENGVAVMVEKRKVRKDFDAGKEYSVDVSGCTWEEKKEVQQGFFDAGFKWLIHGEKYKYTDAVKYTNKERYGNVITNIMHGSTTEGCNMTAKEFLALVYEPEQVGHVHAELMQQYAEDAKTSKTPWQLWEYLSKDDGWTTFRGAPGWYETSEYRRKPKTKLIHGTEVPDLSFTPLNGEGYYYICLSSDQLVKKDYHSEGCMTTKLRAVRGLCYPLTGEGRQAAILHGEALLNID